MGDRREQSEEEAQPKGLQTECGGHVDGSLKTRRFLVELVWGKSVYKQGFGK